MALYGGAMIGAAVFLTDPQLGFPPGTPSALLPGTNAPETWNGQLHTLAVAVLYATGSAACFVFAREFAREADGRPWARALVAIAIAGILVLLVGGLYLQPMSVSSEAFQFADGVAGRVIIPLGWVWPAVVSVRVLQTTRTRDRSGIAS
jgi:hypothetical protein